MGGQAFADLGWKTAWLELKETGTAHDAQNKENDQGNAFTHLAPFFRFVVDVDTIVRLPRTAGYCGSFLRPPKPSKASPQSRAASSRPPFFGSLPAAHVIATSYTQSGAQTEPADRARPDQTEAGQVEPDQAKPSRTGHQTKATSGLILLYFLLFSVHLANRDLYSKFSAKGNAK